MDKSVIAGVLPTFKWLLFCFATALCSCSTIDSTEISSGTELAIVGVDVITMDERGLILDQTILIRGDRISSMGDRQKTRIPESSQLIDAGGHVLMPGLVDAHIHLRHAEPAALKDYLRAGITCVREMNGRAFLLKWRDEIESGTKVGPCLKVAAPTIGNWSSPREGFATPTTVDDGAKAILDFHRAGFDWIKIYTFLKEPGFLGVVAQSKKLGLPVGGHTPVDVGLTNMLSTSVRSIEHLTEYIGSSLTPASQNLDASDFRSLFGAGDVDWQKIDWLIEQTVDANIWNVPTLVWFDKNLPTSLAEAAWANSRLRDQGAKNRRKVVKRLFDSGALLAIGTDSDAGDDLPANAIYDEIEAIADAGIPNEDVLRMATLGGAELLMLADEIGTVAVGKRADLIVLPCNPVIDLTCLRDLRHVISRGLIID